MYTAKNHSEGPDKTVIGGELEIEAGAVLTVRAGATVTGMTEAAAAASADALGGVMAAERAPETDTVEAKIGTDSKLYVPAYPVLAAEATPDTAGIVKQAENQAESVETTSPTAAEFNALLTKLKAAGLMADDE